MKSLRIVLLAVTACFLILFLAIIVFVVSRLYLFAGTDALTQKKYNVRLEELRNKTAVEHLDFDSYGGWLNAPDSSGAPLPGDYFRVEKINDIWWFITPDGHPFVSKGITDVNWLGATLSPGPYHDILIAKYGTEDAWAQAALDRVHGWGFNTVGPWSSHSMTPLSPHSIIILDSSGCAPRYPNALVTDFWSAEFSNNAATVAQQRALPYAEDRNLIGYFLDNELVWGEDHFLTNKTLLQLYMEFPPDTPGRMEALRFLRESAGNLEMFNTTWKTTISDWKHMENLPARTFRPNTTAAEEVLQNFMISSFHKYADVAITALRAVDGNHLILGCRFHTYPGDAMIRAAAEHFDVISMAAYGKEPPIAAIDSVYAEVDKPFFIEEWSFKARGTRLLNIQMYAPVVPNQETRALAYDSFVKAFMQRPYAVGYHWYKWMDNPWEGVKDIIRGDNFGLMNYKDEPYEPFVAFISEVNRRVEIWHALGNGASSQ